MIGVNNFLNFKPADKMQNVFLILKKSREVVFLIQIYLYARYQSF